MWLYDEQEIIGISVGWNAPMRSSKYFVRSESLSSVRGQLSFSNFHGKLRPYQFKDHKANRNFETTSSNHYLKHSFRQKINLTHTYNSFVSHCVHGVYSLSIISYIFPIKTSCMDKTMPGIDPKSTGFLIETHRICPYNGVKFSLFHPK